MKKILKYAGIGAAAGVGLIYAFGYQFIFKAIGLNLKKGGFTPSIDDADKFEAHQVPTGVPTPWPLHEAYNTHKLPKAVLKNLEETKVASLLVIIDGKLLHEQYWRDHHQSSLMNSFSMAKAILSLLVGVAIAEGKIKNENQLFSDFYPEFAAHKYGKHLRLKHLMMMQAGLDWEEEYHHPFAPNSKQYYVADLEAQVFAHELKEMPGRKYEYQSAAPQLLAFALRKAIGQSLASYLSEKIWQPLGMEASAEWTVDKKGMEKAFCCLHATARDFAKIGWLLLQDGKWENQQVLRASYVRQMKKASKPNDAFGYSVWVDDDCAVAHQFLYGFLGQFVVLIPEKQMVIVKTGHDNHLPVDDKLRPLQVSILAKSLCKVF